MKISYRWLCEFLKITKTISPQEIARELTLKTVEVEGVHSSGDGLDLIVVGRVTRIEKHPNADKLQVCFVDAGKKEHQVVCGGTNVREGMSVAFGGIGARVRWHGAGELVTLQKVDIRGVASLGMICASDEIGLSELFPKKEEREIIDLSHLSVQPGTPLKEALRLDDTIFEIDNKSLSNRPDLWGHYGIAREVSAIFTARLQPYTPPKCKAGTGYRLSVQVKNKKACSRYCGVVVGNIQIGSSPLWLQQRLSAIGVRPINNIVDSTNYVMFELGQPTHAFDVDRLSGGAITVRNAREQEKFVTLDGKERVLRSDMLVIADVDTPIAIAGVMGGADSQVSEQTTTVLFESANFDATTVRMMSTHLGLRTEGSARWEKSQDPTNAELGLRRLVELTLQICPQARVMSNILDTGPVKLKQGPVPISFQSIEKKLGYKILAKNIVRSLKGLGFIVKAKKEGVQVTIPTWRATKDIALPEDIIEEVVRLYGYEQIPNALPHFPIAPASVNPIRNLEKQIKELLVYEHGCTEVYTYSFVSPEWLERMGVGTKDYLELNNPIAKDQPLLRRSLIPNLLVAVESNIHQVPRVQLFEIGKTYCSEEKGEQVHPNQKECLPRQDVKLAVVYAEKEVQTPLYELSNILSRLLERLGVSVSFRNVHTNDALAIHPGRVGEVLVGNTGIGKIAELHPQIAERLGIPYRTAMVEINLGTLLPLIKEPVRYIPLSSYPSVNRDIAFVMDAHISYAECISFFSSFDPLLVHVEGFDIYQGNHLGEGKKSIAFHLEYQSKEKTLSSEEVDRVHIRLEQALVKKFDAVIRK